MAKIVDMPKLSPTMEEGLLATWHKKEGDAVAIDDLLAEVETDKATMEFRSFDKGTLLKILVPAGSQVKLGQPVAIVGAAGEDVSALAAKAMSHATPAAPAPAPSPVVAAPAPEAAPMTAAPATTSASTPRVVTTGNILDRTSHEPERAPLASQGAGDGGRGLASPYIRKAARERGIDLTGKTGTGPGGRIALQDLDALAAAPRGASQALAVAGDARLAISALAAPEARPLSMMRKTIARRLTEAKQTVPHFYLTIDVAAGRFAALRDEVNRELAASGASSLGTPEGDKPLKVSLNDLLIKACAVALTRVPECNATFSPEALLIHRRVDISVAVAVPDGLVTPVVRDADKKSLVAVAREVRELAGRARAKKLKPEEMSDGTFSISNLGMFGIDEFSAVINPPEGAILAVGQVREEPVVEGGVVTVGKRMGMTLSCDHRVIDGAVGAAFLAELRALIEHPMRVLVG